MQHFIAREINGDKALLDPGESHHLHRVLRLDSGAQVSVTDGEGKVWNCRVLKSDSKESVLKLEELRRIEQKSHLHLALGPPKSKDRYHMVLEKATEWGVASITPVRSFHSERKVVKNERDARVIQAAVKQSKKGLIPRLHDLCSFQEFIQNSQVCKQGFIAHLEDEPRTALSAVNWQEETGVLIGPEGDFSPEEIQKAEDAGWKGLDLGPEVLRTETAALTVAASAYLDGLSSK